MECDTCREWMSLWLDGRLVQAEIEQVEGHVATCPDCRTALDALRHVDHLLSAAPPVLPAPGFALRFQARLAARHRRRRTWAGILTLGLATLGILLVTGVLLALYGLEWWQFLTAGGWLGQAVGLLLNLGKAWMALLNLIRLVAGGLVRCLEHPAVIAYAIVTATLTLTWTYIVRRRVPAYGPATNG
jgi:predicted anti-sigma-YlaC factor YlaD